MSNVKQPTLFFAPFSCQEGLTANDILVKKRDISGNIDKYNVEFTNRQQKLDIYNNDILDDNGNLLPLNTLKDAVRNDIQTILIQENTMYIVGIITMASMILSAILISK